MGSKVATKGLGFLYAVSLGGYLGEYKPVIVPTRTFRQHCL